jgi:semaphorin 6
MLIGWLNLSIFVVVDSLTDIFPIYFLHSNFTNSIQAEPKLLPQVEEVTYAEPVLLPQASSQNKMQLSPKNTLRKPMGHHHGANSETLFQVSASQFGNFKGFNHSGVRKAEKCCAYKAI